MKTHQRIVVAILLGLTVVVLTINARYLYVSPVANSWVWWRGDETWLMAEYKQFVMTGHATDPLAPGSIFSQSSGLLSGSSYLTAFLYGLPLILIKNHTIWVGRTLTWIFSFLILFVIWDLAKHYKVGAILRASGCLLLAATLCFFITSHSARPDILIGLTVLILIGYLPLLVNKTSINREALFGFLFPLTLLVNGHVFLNSFVVLGYIIFAIGGFQNMRSMIRWGSAAAIGFVCLLIVQAVLLDSFSLLGPFSNASNMVPMMRLFHPKSDLANFNGRIHIAMMLAPALIWIFIVLIAIFLWGRISYNVRLSQLDQKERRLIICASLAVISSVLIEFYQDRYFIYVLPTIVLAFVVLISFLIRVLPRMPVVALTLALIACLIYGVLEYAIDSIKVGEAGKTITIANNIAIKNALATIHSRYIGRPHIFSSIIGQSLAMDDSCDLVTPVMYIQPSDHIVSRSELWNRAKINYAIVCDQANGGDWNESDSSIEWTARSHAQIIFERVGLFSDISRSYDPSGLKSLDTLRVFEFNRN
jgi:hypothetical protein